MASASVCIICVFVWRGIVVGPGHLEHHYYSSHPCSFVSHRRTADDRLSSQIGLTQDWTGLDGRMDLGWKFSIDLLGQRLDGACRSIYLSIYLPRRSESYNKYNPRVRGDRSLAHISFSIPFFPLQ